ncbi:MAG: hypothetical protein PVF05_01400 [Gemmatimonadales bacterium]
MIAGNSGNGNAGNGDKPPQLHIFDAAAREFGVGVLMSGDEQWDLMVVLERTSSDLFRGRISFRRDDERYDTDPIVLGETEEAVIERASELPASMLRQLLESLRD